MKIISYNVNGIRSAMSKGLVNWMQRESADVYCFQETKASPEQVDLMLFDLIGYKTWWFSAEKKGYSGVAIISRKQPDHIEYGFNNPEYDREGRIIRADFGDLSVISVYIPSGSSGEERQAYKMKWLTFFENYISRLKKSRPNLVIGGDYNICREAIDIHDPVGNKNSSGFLPEERAWFAQFIEQQGMVDSFRELHNEPHRYSWWTFRAAARSRNKGWRIDYNLLSASLHSKLEDADIYQSVVHSDHCPVMVKLKL
ncbi:MAG: exodeoxyribonuclease III [Bacteroidia bacterium]|nr:exodeoxyribonuclease III [Bacteroidia bacterium]